MKQPSKLGVIGTGAIASAMVSGLRSVADNSAQVLLSPRNEAVAASLAARYANVSVAADNQAVLDQCDMIVLALQPQVAQKALPELRFHRSHHLVSLIATLSCDEVATLVAPAVHVTRVLPIPMMAHRQGPVLVHPPDSFVASLVGRLGKVIEVEKSSDFSTLTIATATFATYFRYLDTIQRWLENHGIEYNEAHNYIVALFQALGNAPAMVPCMDFMDLAKEYATRGGINEQVVSELTARNFFEAIGECLDCVHLRLSNRELGDGNDDALPRR